MWFNQELESQQTDKPTLPTCSITGPSMYCHPVCWISSPSKSRNFASRVNENMTVLNTAVCGNRLLRNKANHPSTFLTTHRSLLVHIVPIKSISPHRCNYNCQNSLSLARRSMKPGFKPPRRPTRESSCSVASHRDRLQSFRSHSDLPRYKSSTWLCELQALWGQIGQLGLR